MDLQTYILERYNYYLPMRLRDLMMEVGLSNVKRLIDESDLLNISPPEGSQLMGIGRKSGRMNAMDLNRVIRYVYNGNRWREVADFYFEKHFYTVDDIKDVYQLFNLSIQNSNELVVVVGILKRERLFQH